MINGCDMIVNLTHLPEMSLNGYAIIGWVSDAELFYRKTVGAEFIKGGNPENSIYSNLVFM